ncbi:hypothetical protein ONR75_11320 [Rhodopseudomonas sp. P2A-2r]|uniref:hypothetical protein n=1 Tax=Rhodopseudomonas sp. P2A-2r TaxID=2991972 RepID=UPI002233E571|nr:hypothetical protein [Rhodopseudomonas sp. P2A-2r]UZE51147.1 hypothetical protein ONR75_11320 [Rhodopseudomonas sp. P2A-2r]
MTNDQTNRPTINVTSNYQTGGITAHTVHINSAPQRTMGAEHRNQLIREVPREKEVVIWATSGHEESHNFASEIFNFMKASGYSLYGEGPMPQMFIPQLLGVRIRVEKRAEIDVGLMSESDKRAATAPTGIKMTL